jgi:hypothetical protein
VEKGDVRPRKKIWELNCLHKDLILTTSFGREELEGLCREHGVEVGPPGGVCKTHWDITLFQEAHQHCHDETPFALAVQQMLDHRYRAMVDGYYAMDLGEVIEKCFGQPLEKQADLPALLWALGLDDRPGVARMVHAFFLRLLVESGRNTAFGSREFFLQECRIMELQTELKELKERLQYLTG